ncbi:MAG TPA: hypothetical protein VGX48_20615 [Pyrinomonadaceae bacterium]|nr:hypothetical protein [Pyrinomonadaceae bacterium]
MKEVTIGSGSKPNYVGLLLFLAGMAAGAFAIYAALIRGNFVVPTAAALLLMLGGCVLVVVKKEGGK